MCSKNMKSSNTEINGKTVLQCPSPIDWTANNRKNPIFLETKEKFINHNKSKLDLEARKIRKGKSHLLLSLRSDNELLDCNIIVTQKEL